MIFKIILIAALIATSPSFARKDKFDPVVEIQAKIAKAYELGWAKSSPVDMDFIEKKTVEAEVLQKKRKRKKVAPIIQQIEADLKIVEMRHKVNLLNKSLSEEKNKNLLDEKSLSELKEQLR